MATNSWEQRKASSLARTTIGGGTPDTSNLEYWNGTVPWIQSSNVSEESLFSVAVLKHISSVAIRESAVQIIPENSIAVVTHVGVGKLVLVGFSYATSQDFISLVGLTEDPVFSSYALQIKLRKDLNQVQGSAIKGITKNDLLTKDLLIPLREEQNKIGQLLKGLDSLITLHQRKLEKIKCLKKALLEKMFPGNGEEKPRIRFKGFVDPWEQRKFGDIVFPFCDPTPIPKNGYWRLGIRSHAKGVFHEWVPAGHEIETAKMSYVRPDNFIVNITFAWEHAVAITTKNDDGKLVSHRFPQFSFTEKDHPLFFEYLVKEDVFRHHLWLSSPGGAGRNRVLKIPEMLKYVFSTPGIDEQKQVAKLFHDVDALITLHQRKCLKTCQRSHNKVDIFIFQFLNDVQVYLLRCRHACMSKPSSHACDRYSGK